MRNLVWKSKIYSHIFVDALLHNKTEQESIRKVNVSMMQKLIWKQHSKKSKSFPAPNGA